MDDAVNVALHSDGFSSSHPISVPVNNPSEIGEIFDTISYEKVCTDVTSDCHCQL